MIVDRKSEEVDEIFGIIGLRGGFPLFSRSAALFRDDTLRGVSAVIELARGGILLIALFVAFNRRRAVAGRQRTQTAVISSRQSLGRS
jgi:hypothetical protein